MHYNCHHTWTDAEDRLAVEMATAGFSAREIAKKLSAPNTDFHVSRMAVIGRLSRLHFKSPHARAKLISRGQTDRFERKQQSIEQNSNKVTDQQDIAANPIKRSLVAFTASEPPCIEKTLPAHGCSLLEARDRQCRYIIGEPRELICCGEPIYNTSAYCFSHFGRVYAKQP